MKAHLRDSDDPLVEGRDQTANCGAKVSSVKFVFFWDASSSLKFEWETLFGCCVKCRQLPPSGKEGRYIYGIVNGEESKHGE